MAAGDGVEIPNTGPLPALARGDVLRLLAELPVRFAIPRQVAEEPAAGGAAEKIPVRLECVEVRTLSGPLGHLVPVALAGPVPPDARRPSHVVEASTWNGCSEPASG